MPINSGINLGLSEAPEQLSNVEIARAVAPLHMALHALHRELSIATGNFTPTAAEMQLLPASTTLTASRAHKIYLTAAVAITAGQLIYINAAGNAALASAAAAATTAQGIATMNVAAGVKGEFILFEGLVSIAGIVAGTKYYCANAAGGLGLVAGTVPQLVGIGVAPNYLALRIPLI